MNDKAKYVLRVIWKLGIGGALGVGAWFVAAPALEETVLTAAVVLAIALLALAASMIYGAFG